MQSSGSVLDGDGSDAEPIFGKYAVQRRIAVGGMGEIFLARQVGVAGFERLVILKTLLAELAQEESFVHQFLDEARTIATLNHPNVVGVYEVGAWRGTYVMAMEFVDGPNLQVMHKVARASGGPMRPDVAARIAHDAALGLHHAHTAADLDGTLLHIVHRDVSPHNLMVRRDGVTKVVDFGIAKSLARPCRTRTGVVKGKIPYMSPEQINHQPVSASTDQYALGIVLWEMLAGRRAFGGSDDLHIVQRILQQDLPSLRESNSRIPASLAAIVERMIARDPDDRFASCADVAESLAALPDNRE